MPQSNEVFGGTIVLGNAGASVTAGANNTLAIANNADFAISGKAYTRALGTGLTTPAVDQLTGEAFKPVGVNERSLFVLALTAAGAIVGYQSEVESLVDGVAGIAPNFPGVDLSQHAPFAYIEISGGATVAAPWVFGVSNWNATGITAAITNVSTLPTRPPA